MSELGRFFLHPDLRRLIEEAERRTPDPPDAIKRCVAERVDRTLGLGGATFDPLLTPAPPPVIDLPAPGVAPTVMFGWKAAVGLVIAMGIGAAVALSLSYRAPAVIAAPPGVNRLAVATEPAPRFAPANRGPGVAGGARAPRSSDPGVRAVPVTGRSGRGRAQVSTSARDLESARPASRHTIGSPSASTSVDTLAAERVALDGARAALVRRDAAEALVALRRHEQSFPDGQLVEECQSMRVQALVLAHDYAAARAAGERFRRRFPQSMFLPAVEQALDIASR